MLKTQQNEGSQLMISRLKRTRITQVIEIHTRKKNQIHQIDTDRSSEDNEVYKNFFMNPNRYVIERNRTPERIDTIIRISIRYLIVLNIVLGIFTVFNLYIYPKYLYEETPEILRDISTIQTDEV